MLTLSPRAGRDCRRHRRCAGPGLSGAADRDDRALLGRRADRYAGAHHGRAYADLARSNDHHRERDRCGRHHRRRPRGAGGARRLHARHRPGEHQRLQRRRLSVALRSVEGFGAGGVAHDRADVDHRQERLAGEQRQGAGRLAQGERGQGLDGGRRLGQCIAPVRRLFSQPHRHELCLRAVSRGRSRPTRI